MRRLALVLPLLLAGAGCTVGPNYAQPKLATPPAFAEPAEQAGADAARVDLAHWWTAFADPELDRLVQAALAQNIDVQTAISRVREARLGVTIARAQGLPTLGVGATGQYTNSDQTARLHRDNIRDAAGPLIDQLPLPNGLTLPKKVDLPTTNSYQVNAGLDASWQLDIFGGARRGVEAARAQAEAAEWSVRDAQVTVVSEVANAYIQLRQLQAQELIAQTEIARQTRSLDILGNTARAGLVPEGDTSRQRAQLANARASLGPIQAEEAAQVHAIAVLLARSTDAVAPELVTPHADPTLPPAVPPGLPSDLLRRRPDIRAAERQLAAATAQIGMAVADLYPSFSLTGMFGYASQAFGSFLTLSGRQLTGGGSASFPILDWGRRRATVQVRREQAEQSYLAYQQAVLSAMRDVEDALARIATERARNEALRAGVADAQRSVDAIDARFRTGLANQNDVLDVQATVLQQRNQLAQSDGMLRQDLAALYRALGGGWDEGAPVVPAGSGPKDVG